MIYARQSTAITVTVGPTLDADGVAVTGGVVADYKISKNGGAPAALNGSATYTHRHTGYGSLALTATDVGTVGTVEITMDDTVNACPIKEITVLEEAVYDAMFAASALGYIANQPVDVNTIKTQTVTAAAGVTFPTSIASPTNITAGTVTTATNVTTVNGLAAGVITAASIAAAALNGKGDWNIGKTGYALAATGLDLVLAASTGVVEIAKAVWDRVLTGATHNVATSAGKRLREITNSVSQSGTAQAGSTNTITLAAAASSTDGTYDPAIVRISGGTGAGQARLIIHYTGSTRVAVVDRDWRTSPDNTSEYEIIASPNLHSTNEGLAQGGGASTITLNASASSTDDVYNGQLVVIRTGPGQDQSRIITDYVGSTKVATVGEAWATNPTSSSGYMIWPVGRALVTEYVSGQEPPTAGAIATAVAAEIGDGSALTEAGGTGDHLTALASQASVDDLPTNAELATSQAAADDATLAAIAALNNLSSAQVQTAAAAALTAYDPPTNAEMEARTLLAAEYGTAATQATIAGYLDTEVAAIKAKTDQLTFTQANVLDANILYVNGTQVTGDGETGTEWGPI